MKRLKKEVALSERDVVLSIPARGKFFLLARSSYSLLITLCSAHRYYS
jgi:hypothetical protein